MWGYGEDLSAISSTPKNCEVCRFKKKKKKKKKGRECKSKNRCQTHLSLYGFFQLAGILCFRNSPCVSLLSPGMYLYQGITAGRDDVVCGGTRGERES